MTEKEVIKIAQIPMASRSSKQTKQLSEYLRDTILKIPEESLVPKVRSFMSEAQAQIKVHYFKKGTLICTNMNAK